MSCTESLYTAEGVGPRRKTSAETVRSGRVTMPVNSRDSSTEYSFGEEDKLTVVATAGVSQQSAHPALGLLKGMTRRQFTSWGKEKIVPSLTGNNTVAMIDRSCQQTPEYLSRTETTYRPVAEHYSRTQPYRDTLNTIGCLFPLPPQTEEDLKKETIYAGVVPATGQKKWRVATEGALIRALKKALAGNSSATTTATTAPQTAKKASAFDKTWEEQMLAILHRSDDPTTQKRHMSALFIQEERDELNAKLPPELQLSKTSAALAHLSVLSLTGAANRIPKQLGKNLTALTGNRTTTVNDLVHYQLTVANATGPYEPTNATHTILTDRTPQQFRDEVIVLMMVRLQQLRDAQLAFEKGGTAEDLVNAIFAPEEQRCQDMLALVDKLKEATKKARNGKECLDSDDQKTTHSLVLVAKTYKQRLHQARLRVNRTSAISFQTPTTSTPYLAVQQPVNGAPEDAGSQNSSSANALSSTATAPIETTNS